MEKRRHKLENAIGGFRIKLVRGKFGIQKDYSSELEGQIPNRSRRPKHPIRPLSSALLLGGGSSQVDKVIVHKCGPPYVTSDIENK
jgi:hypothetical protein